MPFNDDDCIDYPRKVALHIFDGTDWHEWTGTLNVGDIEIGAVEIKNATTDDRAAVSATGALTVSEEHRSIIQAPQRATAANGAVAFTVAPPAPAYDWELVGFKLLLTGGAGGAGNLTLTTDAIGGAAYDVPVYTLDMTAVTSHLWLPTIRPVFVNGDKVDFAWANASNRGYGFEVYFARRY